MRYTPSALILGQQKWKGVGVNKDGEIFLVRSRLCIAVCNCLATVNKFMLSRPGKLGVELAQ